MGRLGASLQGLDSPGSRIHAGGRGMQQSTGWVYIDFSEIRHCITVLELELSDQS